jgi:hypothetical protein
MTGVIRPFRWNITQRAQLGQLANAEPPATYDGFEEELLRCCARVISFAGDSDVIFVGRSPEPLFDVLSGLMLDTSWAARLGLLNVSLRYSNPVSDRQQKAVRPYFEQVGLAPGQFERRSRPVALVDVVDSGETLGTLIKLIRDWSSENRVEWRAVARKIRIVGLTWREKSSPNTFRWQNTPWIQQLGLLAIKNVSVEPVFATYLAAGVPKLSVSFPPTSWTDESAAEPRRDEDALRGLALAVQLFDLGRTREARLRFARKLARQPAMNEQWFRSLILELKR